MGNTFICYRREDSQFITERIYDHLVRYFPPKSVFKDVDNIPPGVDFRTHIDDAVSQSAVILAIIGPGWLSAKDAGQRRLDDPADFVCVELSSALRLQRSIIPVLVGGARMPTADELPPALRPLAYIHAVKVGSDPDFAGDFARLRRAVERIAGRRYNGWITSIGIAAVALIGIAAVALGAVIVWFIIHPPFESGLQGPCFSLDKSETLRNQFVDAKRKDNETNLIRCYNQASSKDQSQIVSALLDAIVPRDQDPTRRYRVNIHIASAFSRLPFLSMVPSDLQRLRSLSGDDEYTVQKDAEFVEDVDNALKKQRASAP